jgi:hypothetical protein
MDPRTTNSCRMQGSQYHVAGAVGCLLIPSVIPLQTCRHLEGWYVERYRHSSRVLHIVSYLCHLVARRQTGSIDRFHNAYRSPYISQNEKWRHYNEQRLKAKPLILKAQHRKSIEAAIRETCTVRKWLLQAINVRTNQIHTVVSANRKADLVLNAFKANATRQLRQDSLWPYSFSPWGG